MLPSILQGDLILDSLRFAPELLLCVAIVLLLLLRLFKGFDRTHMGGIALVMTLAALLTSLVQWLNFYGNNWLAPVLGQRASDFLGPLLGALEPPSVYRPQEPFTGLLVYDHFTVFLRCFLYAFTALVIWLSMLSGIPDRDDSADFYCLILGAVVGMALMASANHLLMVFIAIEMASLPSYALAGFLKGRRQSSEAALKYVVYGGGAAGIMLYGISLLAGKFGTGYLPDLAAGMAAAIRPPGSAGMVFDPVLVLGVFFILVGVAFKLAAVPFHFWCPDVFEGASAEVAGFLSVASKGAALALLARITLIMGGLDPLLGGGPALGELPWIDVVRVLVPALAFFAALTATFGNLAAYYQTNLKRLLAYSTIAHAGYMMMGLATLTRAGAQAMLFYLIVYLFMNLGAFAVVAFLRNQTHSENLDDFRGLVRRSPWMVVTLSFFLLSLLGIPPLAGFAAKFQIFSVLYQDGQAYYAAGHPGLGSVLYGLLVIGGLNTVISAVYYLKVMKVMILDQRAEDLEGKEAAPLREPYGATAYCSLMALAVLVLGILWNPLASSSGQGVARFRTKPGVDAAGPAMRRPPGMGPGAPGGMRPPGRGGPGRPGGRRPQGGRGR
jgi:NADH-quinone oxidoreductase subunit N